MFASFQLRSQLFVLAAVFFGGVNSFACPESVRLLQSKFVPAPYKSLCQMVDQYAKLKMHVPNADRVADVRAPRFIDMGDWASNARKLGFDPHAIYGPQVWENWDVAATSVDREAAKNSVDGLLPQISISWLIAKHEISLGLDATRGQLRSGPDYGLQLRQAQAASLGEIQNLISFVPYSGKDMNPLMQWTLTKCVEELSPENQQVFTGRVFIPGWIKNGKTFIDGNGVSRQCGWVTYPEGERLPVLVRDFVNWFNAEQALVASGQVDFLVMVARAQRWLVALHPFEIGNGRTSRLLMDYFLESYGLPAPNLREQSFDLSHTEEGWTQEISLGISEALKMVDYCSTNQNDIRCHRI